MIASSAGASSGLGLLSAASWGGSDFIGGLGARRASPLLITVSGQAVSLLILAAVCVAFHLALPGPRALGMIAAAGFEAALALALFYRALSMGAMGLTAALTGLMTALVPVLFSAFHYGLPAPVTLAGLAAGCAAIWLITHQHAQSGQASRTALALGTLAGAGFGSQLILFKLAEPAASAAAAGRIGLSSILIMAVSRAAGVAALLLILVIRRPRRTEQSFWSPGIAGLGIVAGLMDTVGNLFYLGAANYGRLDAAAVICSLYPAGTILLSALVLRERPTRRQMAGMALALGAVALLSL